MDMKFKENLGVDPVTLGKGYTKLDGDVPYTGENILKPQHIAREQQMTAMAESMGWPMDDEMAENVGGFLEREIPEPYLRTRRSDDDDQG